MVACQSFAHGGDGIDQDHMHMDGFSLGPIVAALLLSVLGTVRTLKPLVALQKRSVRLLKARGSDFVFSSPGAAKIALRHKPSLLKMESSQKKSRMDFANEIFADQMERLVLCR